MYFAYAFLLFLPIVVLSGCGEAEKEAPNSVAVASADIVTCLIDSTPWEAGSDKSLPVIEDVVSAELGQMEGKQTFILTAWNVREGVANSISIYAEGVQPGTTVELDGKNSRATYTSKHSQSSPPKFYRGPDRPHGSLTIASIDTLHKRVTGSFQCDLEGLVVQNGKFDAEYSHPVPF